MMVDVDRAKCTGCCSCVLFCPADAIVMQVPQSFVAEIDIERCTECGLCPDYCPNDALKEV